MNKARLRATGHLIDTGLMSRYLDIIVEGGGKYRILKFEVGTRTKEFSTAEIEVCCSSKAKLEPILENLVTRGCHLLTQKEVRLKKAPRAGVAPTGFYSTTHHDTRIHHKGRWLKVRDQRMDAAIVVRAGKARCVKLRDLKKADPVICGLEGVEVQPVFHEREKSDFVFMANDVSSERAVASKVREIARGMREIRKRRGKIIVVAGPVVVHTGGARDLGKLIRGGWVNGLLAGNALAVHDLELSLYGTSLGVDVKTGVPVQEGHRNHMMAINEARAAGSLAALVRRKKLTTGIIPAVVKKRIPVCLAGSIRDDGPVPGTEMDLIKAQEEYARILKGADLVLILSSMLHGIGVGNMIPSHVQTVCVDINPAVVTKLADRGTAQAVGIVTDVGLFLSELASALARR